MKLESIRIQNFRSFADETVSVADYTCFVGPNGCGKSNVLTALNVFFRNSASSSTNVLLLSREDFHHGNIGEPVRITLTFGELSNEAKDDLMLYVRQGKLVLSAVAHWNETSGNADVRQHGLRLVMNAFSRYFKAEEEGAKAAELKAIYDGLRTEFPDLPSAGTGPARLSALRAYEEAHPDLCELLESPNQFFGFTKGANLLGKYVQWVYVPAVKDASTEQEEGSKNALGQIFERTVRTRVNFRESISELRTSLERQYRELVEAESSALDELQTAMQNRLREWSNPSATLQLAWHFDPAKSVTVSEPVARATIGEDRFIGEVARLGHGMQRSFLIALLQELATHSGENAPTLLLGFEEPELFQHPPQAQHIADVLETLGEASTANAQVLVTTHSPHFVSNRGFENVRLVRKCRTTSKSLVHGTTFEKVSARIAAAMGQAKADLPSVMMTTLEQIVQPTQRELYFTSCPVFVEGPEDIAFLATHMKLTGRWNEFRRLGCLFVIARGKSSMSRLVAIAKELSIQYFVVFDADIDDERNRVQQVRDNSCLMRLCGFQEMDPLPEQIVMQDNCVVWPMRIMDSVGDAVGISTWEVAEKRARERSGYVNGVKQKNNLLIAAVLQELHGDNVSVPCLDEACESILRRAATPVS